MSSYYFTNNWHSALIRDVNRVHNAIRDAISNRENTVIIENCAYRKEIAQLYTAAAGDRFVFTHNDLIVDDLHITINLDYNTLSVAEFVAIRSAIGGKTKVTRTSLWLKFLSFLSKF